MKSVAITGYCGTGSSAVVDLLKEYEKTDIGRFNRNNYEQVFLYDINGVFDTVDRLNYSNNLHNSNEIINQFREEMYKLNDIDFGWFGGYKNLCGDRFIKIIESFIEEIALFHFDVNWYGTYKKKAFSFERFIKDIINLLLGKRKGFLNFGEKIIMKKNNRFEFSYADAELLQKATKRLISEYLQIFFNKEKIAILDHLLMPQDAKRIDKYVPENMNMIIVDRDIRDLFVYNKYIWNKQWGDGTYFPTDVYQYIEFTKKFRATEKRISSPKLLRMQFEDLVYSYNDMVKKIEEFVGLDCDSHNEQFLFFDPKKSIKNTQVFRLNDEWNREAEIIQHALPSLCYDFPYNIDTSLNALFG